MNVKELRIGNYVHNNVESFAIQAKDLIFLLAFDNEHYAEPIPLTEEWLLKFGFIKKINNGSEYLRYYWDGDIMIYVDEDTNAMYLGDYDEYHDCKPFGLSEQKIQYVHQLQNLAFLLTGNELTIKQ